MAKVVETSIGDDRCSHKWVKRSKATIQILERACTECGKVELHSEGNITPEEAQKHIDKIKKVN
jgi:hypothetical protein